MDNDIVQRLETATKLAAAAKDGLTRIPTMDAQALLLMLKEKDPVEPELEGDPRSTWFYACGECHGLLGSKDKYCRHCGRMVAWNV